MQELTLGIVTVHLNEIEGLAITRRSLARLQALGRLHWTVVDGNSDLREEGAMAELGHVGRTADCFVSEPDSGIYDAMNKGTSMARGDYVLYLNAGDELHGDFSLSQLEAELGSDRPAMVWGTCYERFPGGALVKVKNRNPNLAWYGMPVNHQNVLFRRDLLGDAPYDEQYRYCADYDLVSRLLFSGESVHRTPLPIAVFEKGGTSARNFDRTMEEEERLRSIHFGVSRPASRAITLLKKLNHRIGKVPTLRRLLRKWV